MWNNIYIWIENHPDLLTWGICISALTFIGTLVAVPIAIISMRADFFLRDTRKSPPLSLPRLLGRLAKNCLGLVLIIMGLAMLFLPGQGLLTMLLGISLVDFPGKRGLELRLIRMGQVRRPLNWIRHRAGKAPLQIPESD